MMTTERIVSVGFLTDNDLRRLGDTFTRHFPVADDGMFDDLIAKLDEVEASPSGNGVMMMPHRPIA